MAYEETEDELREVELGERIGVTIRQIFLILILPITLTILIVRNIQAILSVAVMLLLIWFAFIVLRAILGA